MKHYQTVMIGHVTQDINIDCEGVTVKGPGGAVLYSSAAAKALGHSVAVITKVSDGGSDRLSGFTIPKEDIIRLEAKADTDMKNVYLTPDKERRNNTCLSRGDAFTPSDIPGEITADIYHLAGLLYGDYREDLIAHLSGRGKVAVDVQGYLRHADFANGGKMYFENWREQEKYLPLIDFLKTDAAEAEIMTGTDDRERAAKILFERGAKEIVITHNKEVLAYDGKRICTCPIRARNLSGRTGRGDTTFASYINERLTVSVPEALLTATAAVSLKMETPGPMKADRADVENYIRAFYSDYTA